MTPPKRPLKPRHSPTNRMQHHERDEAIANLIAGINYLVAESQAANLGTAARILSTAKEDMVHWAVDMNFHESAEERFINNQLFGPLGRGEHLFVSPAKHRKPVPASPSHAHKKS